MQNLAYGEEKSLKFHQRLRGARVRYIVNEVCNTNSDFMGIMQCIYVIKESVPWSVVSFQSRKSHFFRMIYILERNHG